MRKIVYLSIPISIGVLIVVILMYMYNKSDNMFSQDMAENLTPVEDISETTLLDYEKDITEAIKQRDFIFAKMYTDIYYDVLAHEGSHEKVTLAAVRRETLEKLQIALLEESLDELIFIFPSDSIHPVMRGENGLDKRMELLKGLLNRLNRQGTFESISYQFYQDKNNNESNKAVIQLHYKDSATVEMPIELEQIGNDPHHFYFQITTPLTDIEHAIISGQK